MADLLDQAAEVQAWMAATQAASSSTRNYYVYAVWIDGEWKTGRKVGTAMECNDHIARVRGVDLSEVRWARGRIEPDGSMLIHPQTDGDAVKKVRRQLMRKKRR